jgi:hypothetical protein
VTANVSGGSNFVSAGKVTFTLSGASVTAAVDALGNATGRLSLPLLTGAFPQAISVEYADSQGNFASSGAATTARWSPAAVLLPAGGFAPSNVQFRSDGSQVVTVNFFGVPVLVETFNALGLLVELDFGLFHWGFTYNSQGVLVGLSLNGIPLF